MSVLCQVCKSRPAKVHYTEIVNNSMVTFHLCEQCAEERGVDVEQGGSYGLGDLVAGLIDTTVDIDSEKIGKVRCPACGYEYSDFKRLGRFGCPECYEAFEAQLVPLLRQIHGSTHHSGEPPADYASRKSRRRRIGDLNEELKRAVEVEDYERAAQLRDEIRAIEASRAEREDQG
jgi:protein arginine kinase activator